MPLPEVEKLTANSRAADRWVHRMNYFAGAAGVGRYSSNKYVLAEFLVLLRPRVFIFECWTRLLSKVAASARVCPPRAIKTEERRALRAI